MARNEVVVIHDGANIIENILKKKNQMLQILHHTGTEFKTKEGGKN